MATPQLIAVVDDEPDVRDAFQRLLRAAGFNVETYGSGMDFLSTLPDRTPGCLVLDLQMPEMTGFDVQLDLAQMNLCIPTIVLTGNDSLEARTKALANGAFAYMTKPVEKVELLGAVNAALTSRQLAH